MKNVADVEEGGRGGGDEVATALGAESPFYSLTLATRSTTHCRHLRVSTRGRVPNNTGCHEAAAGSVV
jgi:hypothetical protein